MWVGLWICGQLIVGIRNDLVIQGKLSSIVEIIIASLFINLILIPLSLIAWLIMKLVFKAIKKPQILSGEKALKNVLIIWSMPFLIVFLWGFSNFKNNQSRNQTLKIQPTSTPSTYDSSQTSETTENWITASINGFEFKYPPGYELQKKGDSQFAASNQRINIYIDPVENPTEYETWISRIKEKLKKKDPSVDKQKVGQYKAYLESRMSAEGTFERNCFIILGNRLAMLTVDADTTIPGNKEPEIYEEVEQLTNQILKTFKFGTRLESNINDDNWNNHPKIIESINIRNEIENEIKSKLYKVETKEYEYHYPYEDEFRQIYIDKSNLIRKYINHAGSDDSALTWDYYYDQKGKLRFVFIGGGAVNGSQLEHKIFFDENGDKIWEIQKYLEGPGYTFPEEWPLEELVFNPKEAFNKPHRD